MRKLEYKVNDKEKKKYHYSNTKVVNYGNRHGWPDPMHHVFPDGWDKKDFEEYKKAWAEHKGN